MCVGCAGIGIFAGWIAPRLGLNSPQTRKGQWAASFLTAAATGISVLALKIFFKYSLCGGTGPFAYRFVIAAIQVVPIALVYAIAFNHFLSKSEEKYGWKPPAKKACCVSL